MNNKKLSRIILPLTIVGMLLMGSGIIYANKSKLEIENISGNRSEMGDMNFIIQSKKGSYETDKFIISKEDEKIKKRTKQGNYNYNLRKEDIENRQIYETTHESSDIFEYENVIGSARVSNVWYEDETNEVVAMISTRNKKSKDINETEIVLEEKSNSPKYDLYISVPTVIDENNIYLTLLTAVGSGESKYNTTRLSLYKLNLQNNTSKKILSEEYDEKEVSIGDDYRHLGFKEGNKAYFLVMKNKEKTGKVNPHLLEFDVISKKINYIDLEDCPMEIREYYKNNDKILLISDEENIGKNFKAYLVDLKNKEIVYRQKLDLGYNGNEMGILDVRVEAGKIYVITEELTSTENRLYNTYYMHVIDEKTNKTLYKGKTKLNASNNTIGGIVKNDEL